MPLRSSNAPHHIFMIDNIEYSAGKKARTHQRTTLMGYKRKLSKHQRTNGTQLRINIESNRRIFNAGKRSLGNSLLSSLLLLFFFFIHLAALFHDCTILYSLNIVFVSARQFILAAPYQLNTTSARSTVHRMSNYCFLLRERNI